MRRFFSWVFLIPIAIILIAFSVANRHWVSIGLDPFNIENPAFSVSIPLFVLVFLAIIAGILLGGLATWLKQGKHRKLAREKRLEADKWRNEADIQKQRADESFDKNNTLPAPKTL